MKIEKNLGTIDRTFRFIGGILLFYLALLAELKLYIILLAIFGTIALYESLYGFCGLYKLLKINTRRR